MSNYSSARMEPAINPPQIWRALFCPLLSKVPPGPPPKVWWGALPPRNSRGASSHQPHKGSFKGPKSASLFCPRPKLSKFPKTPLRELLKLKGATPGIIGPTTWPIPIVKPNSTFSFPPNFSAQQDVCKMPIKFRV